jgi:hypothetical protein
VIFARLHVSAMDRDVVKIRLPFRHVAIVLYLLALMPTSHSHLVPKVSCEWLLEASEVVAIMEPISTEMVDNTFVETHSGEAERIQTLIVTSEKKAI